MKKKLVIDLASLPEDGKAFVGELDPEIYGLPSGDAVPVGPLAFDLWVQRFGPELVMTGCMESSFEFTCVRGLHPYVQTIVLNQSAMSLEIGHHVEIDVTEVLREEVVINFPVNPRCEDADEPVECIVDSRYFVVDKPGEPGTESPPRVEGADPWSVLDKIKDFKDQP